MSTTSNNDKPYELLVYSFRAKSSQDVGKFLYALSQRNIFFKYSKQGSSNLPDVYVELRTSATIEDLRDVLRTVKDSHVMLETLKALPLSEDNLERDISIVWLV